MIHTTALQSITSWLSSNTMNLKNDDDLNLSGLKKSWHGYGLSNQTLQLFDYLKQSWLSEDNLHQRTVYRHEDQQFYLQEPLQLYHRFPTRDINNIITDKAGFNAHDMELSSTLGNGLYSDVQSPTAQTFIPYPRTHGYSSDIADAFASNMKQMQENLTKFINHSNTMQEQRRMPSRIEMYVSGHKHNLLRWNDTDHHDTTVPSAYDPRLNEFQTGVHTWL